MPLNMAFKKHSTGPPHRAGDSFDDTGGLTWGQTRRLLPHEARTVLVHSRE
jgi:hypothetical protein